MSAPLSDQAQRIGALEKKVNEFHASDLTNTACFWMFLFVIFFAVVVSIWVLGPVYNGHHHHPLLTNINSSSSPPSPGYYMKHQKSQRRHQRGQCNVMGEVWDAEVSLCAPVHHLPLALDPSIMNTSLKVCDSFYDSMCGRYITSHTNENRAFSYGWRRTRERLRQMIATSNTSALNEAGSLFYRACLSRGGPASIREALLEYKHLLEFIVGPIRSHADIPSALGKMARYGYTSPFAISMERHPLEPRILPFWSPDGFPTPILDEGRLFQILQASRSLTGYTSMQEAHHIESVLRISRSLGEHRSPNGLLENVTNYGDYLQHVFHQQHLKPFGAILDGPTRSTDWVWDRYFEALDGNALRFQVDQQIWMPDASYLSWFVSDSGWRSFSVVDWKAYLEFSILYNGNEFEPELPNNVYFRQHDAQGPVGKGARLYHRIPRATTKNNGTLDSAKCLALTEHMIPGWVADAYLRRYMPRRAEIRESVTKMVQFLLAGLRARVARASWLSSENRAALDAKIANTLIRVLEPDQWEVEPFLGSLAVDRHDHNMNLVRRYRVQRNLALWHKDTAASWWSRAAVAFFAMPLTEMNAYYSGPSNSITLLAGVLQHPLYNPDYDDVSKWAILGSIVGHELSHMLDSHGLYWDADGNYRPGGLLDVAGMSSFYQRTECVVREYGPAPAGCENANAHYGNSTIGEDLADLVGISLSYETFFSPTSSAPTGDRQHFFMVLAQAFCETYDQSHLCDAVAHDEHAVAEFRINRTFRNLASFLELFGCHPGQSMWQSKEDQCIVY